MKKKTFMVYLETKVSVEDLGEDRYIEMRDNAMKAVEDKIKLCVGPPLNFLVAEAEEYWT